MISKTGKFLIRKPGTPLIFASMSLFCASASASLIGGTVSFGYLGDPNNSVATGIAGTDDLTVEGGFGDEFFIPTFINDLVTITFSTPFS